MPEALLQVRGLTVELSPHRTIVDEVSFDVDSLAGQGCDAATGSIVGLFGESGCGKTTLALALLDLLPPDRYRVRGSVLLRGRELLGLDERSMEGIRGAALSLISQDPMLALNPVLRVRDQVREVLRAHGNNSEVAPLFELVGLTPSGRILKAYPHQLSGGERQRVVIAQALACRPSLVIADEPFSALDAIRVVELAKLFRELKEKTGSSFLLISHSPGVLARIADSVLVMRQGRIVESGPPSQVFRSPAHPYTASLLAAAEGIAGRV